uniref:Uncharacterized protein n=1 Tax=Arion vulgaris TaxID=1028688 RepID=A0A0B7B3Q7_9EUPU
MPIKMFTIFKITQGPLSVLQSLCTASEIFLCKKEIRAYMVTHPSAMMMILSSINIILSQIPRQHRLKHATFNPKICV